MACPENQRSVPRNLRAALRADKVLAEVELDQARGGAAAQRAREGERGRVPQLVGGEIQHCVVVGGRVYY